MLQVSSSEGHQREQSVAPPDSRLIGDRILLVDRLLLSRSTNGVPLRSSRSQPREPYQLTLVCIQLPHVVVSYHLRL